MTNTKLYLIGLCKKILFFSLRLLQNRSFTKVNSQFISFASLKNKVFFIKDLVFLHALITLVFIALGACKTTKEQNQINNTAHHIGNNIVLYKTHKNYTENIPVQLTEDKTKLVSFPAITDVKATKKPIKLKNDYYLDRFGININTAYTDYTFETYTKFQSTPAPSNLFEHILDNDPYSEFYISKNFDLHKLTTQKLIDSLNVLIDSQQLNVVMEQMK